MPATPFSAAEISLHADFLSRYPVEAANLFEKISGDEAAAIVAPFDAKLLAPVFEVLSPVTAEGLLRRLPESLTVATMNLMAPSRVAAFLRTLPQDRREPLVAAVESAMRRDLELLLECEPNTAGAVMDPRVLYLRRDMQVSDALARLRAQRHHRQHARARRIMVIVDESNRLEGIVAIQDLALAEPDDFVHEYMQPVPAFVTMSATNEEIVEEMDEHRVSSLPVVDGEGGLVGVVRYEELVAAAKEDAAADIQAMFGVSRSEQALSPPWFSVRRRLPWLEINLATAFLAAAVVGLFESTIARYTALAVLLPVVAGQSGNTGAQALAVVMRGLALREINLRHWRRVIAKEFSVGLINGVVVALTTALGVYLWSKSAGLTLVIGLAMVVSMGIAGGAGATIPLLLTRIGQDPAQSSSIILTTVTDVAGFFSFLGIATAFITLL